MNKKLFESHKREGKIKITIKHGFRNQFKR